MRPLPSRKLDKRVVRVWRLSAAVNVVIWSLVGILPIWILRFTLAADPTHDGHFGFTFALWGLSLAAVILFALFVVVVPSIRYRQWSFDVLDEEIDIHKGIFWRTRTIIPLIRVQNVDTKQGPILRANGLASFTVSTAAGEHAIPGLEVEEADKLRDHVAVLARIAQEDV
ncbi:MAG: PH domain-containing protein [Propionibacteriaceae bacterium]|jgi:membrane protein YdbS with pleckstrin-like domain|nr:PH domain-containing protein [Propionibacteriaceae bacterium]